MAGSPSSYQHPGHPEPQTEGGPVVAGVEQEELAPPPVGHEPAPEKGCGHLVGGEPALEEPRVGRHDRVDPPAQGGRRGVAVQLHLEHLGHGGVLAGGDAVEGLSEVGDQVVGVLQPG